MTIYGAGVAELLGQAAPSAHPEPADETFRRLEAVKTPRDLERLRVTCRIVEQAFRCGAERLRAGLLETEAAAHFAVPLGTVGTGFAGVGRGGGYAWCMSGPNAAEAQGAYARSRPKPVARGELVLVHCNAFADGYWVDLTRTYCLGDPDRRQGELFDAVLRARAAALEAIRPGRGPPTSTARRAASWRASASGRSSSTRPGTASASTRSTTMPAPGSTPSRTTCWRRA